MPAMAWYEIKVTGTLGGSTRQNQKQIYEFQELFPTKAPPAPPANEWSELFGWPEGFVLPGYKAIRWLSTADDIPAAQSNAFLGVDKLTLLTFNAELFATYPGTLFTNRVKMLAEVDWFYRYCNLDWYMDLKRKIHALNDSFAASANLIGRVDFRDWKWYCGNGGGD
jgi:hypothetical protein